MSRIDRIRRAAHAQGQIQADNDAAAPIGESRALTVSAVQPTPKTPPPAERDGAAILAAQLMGQEGQKRGLRAGPPAIEAARGAYNKVEWSGAKDRRARAGRTARTEV